ncbi:MAG: hypothetical protein ACREMO_08795 [Gemmatimonadales bacterium]
MKASRHYLIGSGTIALAALPLAWLVQPANRPGVWLGLGLALAVQLPLGWWLLESVGTRRFIPVWVLGMLLRLLLVGLTGLVIVPALNWPLGPVLISLAVLLVSFLLLEGAVLLFRDSTIEAR